ncbi:MAG: Hsp70 family protein [Pseudomonadota bacterium]
MDIVGIDLGTSNSLIGYWDDDLSRPQLVENVLGSTLTPSVVSVDDNGEFLIGAAALERLITHPDRSAALFKRQMGSRSESRLGKHRFRAEELSALVIRQLLQDFEAQVGRRPTDAVISVPAYFSDGQRRATKLAGEIAGLQVERLINEPTAAALAYGVEQRLDDAVFAVIDLGGGTLDVTVLEYFSGVVQVRASSGDRALGGADFDQAVLRHCLAAWEISTLDLVPKDLALLSRRAREAKCQLSSADAATIQFSPSTRRKHGEYEMTLTRAGLETLSNALTQRIVATIDRALRDSSYRASDMDEVLLVGGATRMPVIRNLVGRLFRKLPLMHVSPDEAIALGAITQAALKADAKALEDVVLTDVAPYTLGVDVAVEQADGQYEVGHFLPIIERNSPVPVSRVETLHPVSKKQRKVECNVYQGESRKVVNNVKLGQITQPLRREDGESLDVRFTYDVNGILEVVTQPSSDATPQRLVITGSELELSPGEAEKALEKIAHLKIHPRETTENRTLLARAERLYEESLGQEREIVASLIREFEQVLATQDHELVAQQRAEFEDRLDALERDPLR